MTRRHLALLLLLTLAPFSACSEPPGEAKADAVMPEFVFVPTDDHSTTVEISVLARAMVDEWIPVRAQRWSGGWKRVRREAVRPGALWFTTEPPGFQREVAWAVSWKIEPPNSARFEQPAADGDPWSERRVKFSKPGTYKIWAVSLPPYARSNVVTVTVRAGR